MNGKKFSESEFQKGGFIIIKDNYYKIKWDLITFIESINLKNKNFDLYELYE